MRREVLRAGLLLAVLSPLFVTPTGSSSNGQAESEADTKARLEALGYLAEVGSDPDPARNGVAVHDEERSSGGINVYCSVSTQEIKFLDMDGELLHTIRMPHKGSGADCMLEPDGLGDFIALAQPGLVRIDWDSKVAWTSRRKHHHDFALAPNGEVHSFSTRPGEIEHHDQPFRIVDQAIVVLDEDGELIREVAFEPLFADRIQPLRKAQMLENRYRPLHPDYLRASDVYHPNTIAILQHDSPLGRRGDWLICLRSQNLVAVIDSKRETIGWTYGPGVLDAPHHPSVLENGNLLIFDNGRERGWSRVVEVDPVNREIVWRYSGKPAADFFSKVRGSAQGLGNGNVLITESTKGRVFEVTREGEIVWDFWNPDRTAKGERRQIYRMIRVSRAELPQLRASGSH